MSAHIYRLPSPPPPDVVASPQARVIRVVVLEEDECHRVAMHAMVVRKRPWWAWWRPATELVPVLAMGTGSFWSYADIQSAGYNQMHRVWDTDRLQLTELWERWADEQHEAEK